MGGAVMMKNIFIPLTSGIIIGIGLVIAGMTNPAKVMGFLNVFGNWDPSLMFVMGGAIIVSMPAFLFIGKKMSAPLFNKEEGFSQQLKKNIDSPLVLGSAMFGIGWALVGFCPGPAIAALTQVDGNVFMFFYSHVDWHAVKKNILNLIYSLK
jgi:uncharacterized membrane protein YedE/YeeE